MLVLTKVHITTGVVFSGDKSQFNFRVSSMNLEMKRGLSLLTHPCYLGYKGAVGYTTASVYSNFKFVYSM